MTITKYKCYFCDQLFEYLDQQIWDIKIPRAYRLDESPKLYLEDEHCCFDCGVRMYKQLIDLQATIRTEHHDR